MQLADLDLNKTYSYADYLKWTFQERVELIKGKIFPMSPAPNVGHQRLSMGLGNEIYNFLRGKKCEVFAAPFDVRFPRKSKLNKDILTVVQPDIVVVCDPAKIDKNGCLGAPELVIEILSPSNNKKELKYKHQIYEEGGVKEYWIVNPTERSVLVYMLTDGRLLASSPLYEEDVLTSPTLPGFSLNLADLFRRLI